MSTKKSEKITGGHILFDLDGTLIESMGPVAQRAYQVMREFTHMDLDFPSFAHRFRSRGDYYVEILEEWPVRQSRWKGPGTQLIAALFHRFEELEALDRGLYQPFPGVLEALSKLKERGHQLYLWTSRWRAPTQQILKALSMNHFFEHICCGNDKYPKPHPRGALEMLGPEVDSRQVVVVGDSTTDIEGAGQLGARAIGAHWCQMSSKSVLASVGPDFLVSDVLQCHTIIADIFNGES